MSHQLGSERDRSVAAMSAVLLALAASACSEASGDLNLNELPVWSTEPEVRIGAVDDPDYAFGFVTALQVGADGTIYSLHSQEATIRRWTRDGLPAGGVGRAGEGPGELTTPRAMGWHGDSLWVFDGRQYRISFFTPDGTYLESITPRVDLGSAENAEAGSYPARPSSLLGDGSVLAITPGFSSDIVEGKLTRLAYLRKTAEGAPLDTLAMVPVGPANVLGVLREGGGGTFGVQPFSDAILAGPTQDGMGILVLERHAATQPGPAEFRLIRLDLTGATVFARSYPYEPVPLPRARVDSAIGVSAASLHRFVGERTGTSLSQWEGWVGAAMYVPPNYTPVSQLVMGRDGTTWLALNPPAEGGPNWLVLDEEGIPQAKVRVPAGVRVLLADRTSVWGVEQDQLEVNYIVRYGVRPGASAP